MSFIDTLISCLPRNRPHMAPLRLLLSIYADRLVDMPPFPTPSADIHTDASAWRSWLCACRDSLINHPVFLQDNPVIQRDRRVLDVAFYLSSPIVLDALESGFEPFDMIVDTDRSSIRPKAEDYPLIPIEGDDAYARLMNAFIGQIEQQDRRVKLTAMLYAFQNMDRTALNDLIESTLGFSELTTMSTDEGANAFAQSAFNAFHKSFRQIDVDPYDGRRDMLIWHMIYDWDKEGLLFNACVEIVNKSIEY